MKGIDRRLLIFQRQSCLKYIGYWNSMGRIKRFIYSGQEMMQKSFWRGENVRDSCQFGWNMMEILDRRITAYKDGSRVGIIDFKGKHSLSLLKVILMKVHNIGYTIDSVRGRQYDYYDDDGYKHHGQSRINNLTASDDFETGIDELLVSLYGDIYSFSAHMADHHIFFNVFEMENDFRTRLLLEYRKEYAEFNDFFKLTEWN